MRHSLWFISLYLKVSFILFFLLSQSKFKCSTAHSSWMKLISFEINSWNYGHFQATVWIVSWVLLWLENNWKKAYFCCLVLFFISKLNINNHRRNTLAQNTFKLKNNNNKMVEFESSATKIYFVEWLNKIES